MPRFSVLVALVGMTMAVGCGMQSSSPSSARGGLAVVDLDLLAKTVGRTQDINEALKAKQAGYEQALQSGLANFRKQIEDKKKEFGETPTEEQQKILAAMDQRAGSMLIDARNKAQRELESYRQTLIGQFRNEVRPWAQQVASEKGLSVVIPKNEGFLLSVDPGVDITADVIKVLQIKKPAAPASTASSAPAASSTPAAAAVTPSRAPATAEGPTSTETN